MLERSEEDELFVEDGVRVVARDVMGTNGVMHVVNKPVMPGAGEEKDRDRQREDFCFQLIVT